MLALIGFHYYSRQPFDAATQDSVHLTPEKPKYPGGLWHIEGTGSEQIVATGLYHENITDSELSFRVIVDEPDYEQNDRLDVTAMYGLERHALLVQPLGAATAIDGRCLVFPNTLQHKIEPFELGDPTMPGLRKIPAFFLVDPTKTIPSTSVIPPQQKERLQELMNPLTEGTTVPFDAVKDQLAELPGGE
ncbi:hypothetical protein Poli38472_013527 [Pythium oligandrum]|uniref:DUF4246 domain-containing protein n=1 Tax=Pythium oligandrum TaxID=41045 RepID=A0A8K1C7X7_PYTOL|nr:hypothetical protein Poli38472_013527 [Pythium oligandrum]|eukprot:TMW58053.1 hypothetical protein Poli38472_013527 [Pythium oligandrum]